MHLRSVLLLPLMWIVSIICVIPTHKTASLDSFDDSLDGDDDISDLKDLKYFDPTSCITSSATTDEEAVWRKYIALVEGQCDQIKHDHNSPDRSE